MQLYAHPFSSYCQKVLTALYENATAFEYRLVAFGDERAAAEFAALWPLKKFPVLVGSGRTVVETSVIIEYLGLNHPGPVRLLPEEPHVNDTLKGREWAAGGSLRLADCAAAPALFYADRVHAIGPRFPNVSAYRRRLRARPSFARAVDEGRPYRQLFPPGAPDRD